MLYINQLPSAGFSAYTLNDQSHFHSENSCTQYVPNAPHRTIK